MGFTQPVCHDCWIRENDGVQPTSDFTLEGLDEEKCCKCGDPTTAGIFISVDPKTVPYPTKTA